ncbi:MAG: zf-HC2 domain-containing protein [Deltaproteobacteria bacterium]|nr:zf-HC2 domain-containing protein [Deltaproteobacteria bacterium]
MKPPDKIDLDDHPKDMLLAYLEGTLSGERSATVEAHINTCHECALDLDSLGKLAGLLKTEKEIFCPEPWDLLEFIETGQDPQGRLAKHIERCPLCCAEVVDYRETAIQKTLPSEIKAELKKAFPKSAQSRSSNEKKVLVRALDWLNSIFRFPTLDWLNSIFRFPTIAIGTAVAAILAVILLYPHGTVPTFIGVSSENWKEIVPQATPKSLFSGVPARKEIAKPAPRVGHGASKPMLFEAPKPRLAPVIIFHGFEKPLPQSTIDSLYEGLKIPILNTGPIEAIPGQSRRSTSFPIRGVERILQGIFN